MMIFSQKFLISDGFSFLSEPVTETENRSDIGNALEILNHQIEPVGKAPDLNKWARNIPKFLLDQHFEVVEQTVGMADHVTGSFR